MFVVGGCYLPVLVALPRVPPSLTVTDHNLRFDGKSTDAMVIFGFASPRSVWLAPGIDDGVNWHCGRGGVVRLKAEGGFIVARLPARVGKTKYAIVATSLEMEGGQGPSANGPIWMFDAEPGKVAYLGGFRLGPWSDDGPSIVPDERFKQSEADDFLTSAFPNVPIHVTTGQMNAGYVSAGDSNGCFLW